MRARLISAAVVAVVLTGAVATPVKAQIVIQPTVNTSPYRYSNIYNNPAIANYYAALTPPSSSYWYGYNYPGYQTYSYGWSNPYSNWSWSQYQTYPTNYPNYPNYNYYSYRGWRRW